MSSRNRPGAVARITRRAAVLTATAATSLAMLAAPALAMQGDAKCTPFSVNTPAAGINIGFPPVSLATDTGVIITLYTEVGGQATPQAQFAMEPGWTHWHAREPEILGGRVTPWAEANNPRSVAVSLPGAGMVMKAFYNKEYYEATPDPNRQPGTGKKIADEPHRYVQAPDGSQWCRS